MKIRKTLSAALASVMAVSSLTPAFAANIQTTGFHHAYMSGVGNGKFEPARNMSRAEAVVMLARLFYNVDGGGYAPTFTDVPANKWYSSYIGWAQANGFLERAGQFRPNDNITRAEYLDLLFRFKKVNADTKASKQSFSDLDGVSDLTASQIAYAVSKGWISGYSDGTFHPNAAIQRDEVTSMTNRVVGRSPDKQHIMTYLPSLVTFSDVAASSWAYYDVLEATNSHNLYGSDTNGEIWSARQQGYGYPYMQGVGNGDLVNPYGTPINNNIKKDTADDDDDGRYRVRAIDGDHGVVDGKKTFYTNRSGKITDLPDAEPDDGYVFVQWVNTKTGRKVKIGSIIDENITIEPEFEQDCNYDDGYEDNRYVIQFVDSDNGVISDTMSLRTNKRGVVPSLPHVYPDDGYVFVKWINADTGRVIQAGDTIHGDIVLMPVYRSTETSIDPPEEGNSHKISFAPSENGTIDDDSPIWTDEDGKVFSLPDVTPDEGYELDKWVTVPGGEEVNIGDKLEDDTTIKPVFKESDKSYQISFVAGSGGIINDMSPIRTNQKGVIEQLPAITPDKDFSFEKWVIDGTEIEVAVGTKLNQDVTLQPIFVKNITSDKIKIAFQCSEGGRFVADAVTEVMVDKGIYFGELVETGSLPTCEPEDALHEFDGWYTSSGEKITEDIQLNFSRTITAKFKEKEASPLAWFTYDGNTLTGFSDEYKNMANAPTDIILPDNAGGSSLTTIGENAFKDRNLLTSITMPASYTSISAGAFENCISLQKIYGPSIVDTSNKSFQGCENLLNISMPKLSIIGDYCFKNCDLLTSLEAFPNLTTIGKYAFEENNGLTTLVLPESLITIDQGAFQNCANIDSVIWDSNGDADVAKGIKDNAFSGCVSLEMFMFPSKTKIGLKAFSGCSKLKSLKGESIESLKDNSFVGCDNLTDIELIKLKITSPLAFYGCSSIESITLDVLEVTNASTENSGVFYSNSTLKNIDIKDVRATNSDYLFSGCQNLNTVKIGFTKPKNASKGIFKNCNFKEVYIYDHTTFIPSQSFYKCEQLMHVSYPANLINIQEKAFLGCAKLIDYNLPDCVETIGESAFEGCESMEYKEFPKNIHTLGARAFCKVKLPREITLSDDYNWKSVSISAFYSYGTPYLEKLFIGKKAAENLSGKEIPYSSSSGYKYRVPFPYTEFMEGVTNITSSSLGHNDGILGTLSFDTLVIPSTIPSDYDLGILFHPNTSSVSSSKGRFSANLLVNKSGSYNLCSNLSDGNYSNKAEFNKIEMHKNPATEFICKIEGGAGSSLPMPVITVKPTVTSIPSNFFPPRSSREIILNIEKPVNSISGAPWGDEGQRITVNWNS